jgi:hypothetical protein
MSAGAFTRTFYEDDDGDIHPIRLQPETLAATFASVANAAPAGPVDNEISAQVTGSRRGLGLFARYVTVKFTATPPTGYVANAFYKIAIPNPTVYAGITVNSAGEYLETAIQVISKTDEVQR